MKLYTLQVHREGKIGRKWLSEKAMAKSFEHRYAEFHSYADKVDVRIQWGANDLVIFSEMEETIIEAEEDK